MSVKDFFSLLAGVLTILAFLPYIRAILRGHARPHVLSWIIWGSTTFVVFLAQLSDGAGVGAWPIGLSGLITLAVAGLAFRHRGDISIKRIDYLFLVAAFSALPFWYFTSNPLWAVSILTLVDLLGFGPTFRKGYDHPHQDSLVFFMLMTIRNLLVVAALQHYSATTVMFPASIAVACMAYIVMVMYRRADRRAT